MVKNLDNAGKFLMYPRFVQVFLDKQLEGMSSHKRIYVTPSQTKKIFRNMKRVGKGFSGRETPLFPTMVLQNQAEMGEDEAIYEERDDSLERAATTATGLDAEQDRGNINKTQSKATPNEPSSPGTSSGGGPRRQETMGDTIAQTRSENVSKLSNDPLLARVIDLENTKTAQAQEITSLKLRVKKLEKKGGSRTHKLKRLYKVGRSARIVSSDEASLDVLDDKEVFAGQDMAEKEVSTTDPVTTVGEVVTIAEITTASTRPKAKGLVIHKEEQATTPKVSSQQPSQVNVQDKGKGKMVEPKKPMKKKELIRLDEEIASKLQAEFDEEQKLEEDKETAELQRLIKVVPDKEELAIDVIPLATKPPSIIDYKIYKEGKKTYYQIIKADGSLKIYIVFSHMLKSFNREDLETLWKLVKAKHGSTRPEEGFEECVIGWLKTMFESTVKNKYGGINRITEYWIGSYMIHVEYIH
ncbi:hypothetical protein Tco_0397403 [Tanacetum coccineum]